ncbi:MAG: transposase [Acidobacteriota bacterium]
MPLSSAPSTATCSPPAARARPTRSPPTWPLLAACYATSLRNCDSVGDRAGLPSLRLVGAPPPSPPSRRGIAVHHEGFSLHVGDQIDGRDRKRLERLIRYVARPPIANDRLRMRPDGSVAYTMKAPWSDGTRAVSMDPLHLIARLCALVPPPRFHTVRYHGVLAAHAVFRPLVVPGGDHDAPVDLDRIDELIDQLDLFPLPELPSPPRLPRGKVHVDTPRGSPFIPYHELLRRVFKVDIHACPRCSERLRIRGAVTEKADIDRILLALGIPADEPAIAPARDPPQRSLHL